MTRVLAMVALAATVACVGSGDDVAGTDGGAGADADPSAPDADPNAPDADPNAPDAAGCASAAPDPAPTWLASYQDEIVAKLSGAQAIGGITLIDRATASRRATARGFIADQLGQIGYTAQTHDYGGGTNVYAELPATQGGGAWVVLGAHYDSVSGSPGANDNATGVAMVLAAARYLRTVECRSVAFVFVLFDQEEIGLVGSAAFADWLVSDGRSVAAVHTVDQMGWDDDGDRAIELERASTGLAQLYAAAKSAGGYTMALTQTSTGSTDHVSFRDVGFRAIGLTEEYVSGDTTPYYHTSQDTYATVNFAYLASTSELVNYTLAEVALGNLAAAPAPAAAVAPVSHPSRERYFDHRCGGEMAPSSAITGAVSGKSAADSR